MTDKRRKITFYLNPETSEADATVSAMLNKLPLGDRGRVNRSMLVAGAALRVLDSRLPDLLTALLREGVSRDELVGCLAQLLPVNVRRDTTTPEPETEPSADEQSKRAFLAMVNPKGD